MSIHLERSFWRLPVKLQALTMVCVLMAAATALAQTDPGAAPLIDADGTVHVPAHAVPISDLLSAPARAYVTEHLLNMQRPEMLVQQNGVPPLLAGYLQRQRESLPVERRDVTIGDVHAYEFTRRVAYLRPIESVCSSIFMAVASWAAGLPVRNSSPCPLRRMAEFE
jgi:hypothetical protein